MGGRGRTRIRLTLAEAPSSSETSPRSSRGPVETFPPMEDRPEPIIRHSAPTLSLRRRFDLNFSDLDGTRASFGRRLRTSTAKGHYGRGGVYNKGRKINRAGVLKEIRREKAGLPGRPRKSPRVTKKSIGHIKKVLEHDVSDSDSPEWPAAPVADSLPVPSPGVQAACDNLD